MLLTHLLYSPSQSLQALKKISLEHPTACLRAGALMAVLSYLDFFSTGVQVCNLASSNLLTTVPILCTVCIYLHLFLWGDMFVVEGRLVYRRKYLQEAAVRCFRVCHGSCPLAHESPKSPRFQGTFQAQSVRHLDYDMAY